MSNTALATLGDMPSASKYGENDPLKDDYTKGFSFLPRIQFFSDQARLVKTKKFPMNHFALVFKKDEMHDLGETFAAIPLAYRYKAVDFRVKGKVKAFFDPNSADFEAVAAEAKRKRPQGEKSECMAGLEFLLGIQHAEKFTLCTLHCTSASLKKVAKKLDPLMRKFVSFGSVLIEGDFVYQAPIVSTFSGSFDLGCPTRLRKEIIEFTAMAGVKEEEADDDAEDKPADRPR